MDSAGRAGPWMQGWKLLLLWLLLREGGSEGLRLGETSPSSGGCGKGPHSM